jgi:hypothetical protein
MDVTRRWIPLVAVIALLGAAMLAASFANPTIEQLPITPPSLDEQRPELDAQVRSAEALSIPPAAAPSVIPGWITWVVSAICFAIVATVVGLMLWYFLRDRLSAASVPVAAETAPLPTVTQTRRRMRDALDEGLAELDDDGDPRRVVIACWVRLEAAAAAAGTPREPGDTTTDLVGRLLGTHEVSAALLAEFAAVYREARFAPHIVDVAMRDQARQALLRLRDELAVDRVRSHAPAAAEVGP